MADLFYQYKICGSVKLGLYLRRNGIFHFGCTALDGITGRTILAEVYPNFTEKKAEPEKRF